jgi:hypothetical protein
MWMIVWAVSLRLLGFIRSWKGRQKISGPSLHPEARAAFSTPEIFSVPDSVAEPCVSPCIATGNLPDVFFSKNEMFFGRINRGSRV